MALDFNKAFVQSQTLASKSGMSIEHMKTQVLALAQATGQDPGGLANALYQVLSAGKAAASQAFPILTAAAKGAAIGMGSVTDVAKVLVTTMNAYGPANLSAATAADVLTQATKDSAAQADVLTSSLGPVIGIAAQVGVSFQEVAASIAVATNQGIDAARAATGLRFLLSRLSAETPTATDALKKYGISLQELHNSLTHQGLIATLQMLADKFDLSSVKGQQAWQAVTGGARGAAVAATLVGKHAADATAELDRLNGAAGRLNKSFTIWGQTITGKNAIALGKLKVAAIQLGEKLIPIFEKVVGAVTDLVDAFSKLPAGMQGAIAKGIIFAALAGPFLKLGGIIVGLTGKFVSMASAASKAASAGGAAASAAAGAAPAAGAALPAAPEVAAAGSSLGELAPVAALAVGLLNGIHIALDKSQPSWIRFGASVDATGVGLSQLGTHLLGVLGGADSLGTSIGHLIPPMILFAAEQKVAARGSVQLGGAMGVAARETLAQRQAALAVARANNGVTQSADSAAGSMAHAAGTSKAFGASLGDTAGGAKNATGAVVGLTGAINNVKSKKVSVTANTGNSVGAVLGLVGAISQVQSKSVTISVHTVMTGTSSYKQVHGATGGIFPMGGGGITQAPVYQFGEGGYSTFAGRGAEAVIPLNEKGIGILSKAMKKAGGGPHINVTINTQGNFDENTLAASVSRHLARTIREEALV
jgi:TP901 family phage tail tape measure protein